MVREHGTFGRRSLITYRGDGLSLHGKETWSQYRLCVDRTTSEWIWMYEKWTVGQSGDYAKVMIGDGIML